MRVAVIGGGAAGVFAAINAAAKNPRLTITLFEAAPKPLQKVFISGGGRCNVTHHCFDSRELATHYPRGGKALLSVFSRFQPQDTIQWFEMRGLRLKTEPDGRIFPVTDSSQSVIELFLKEALRTGVQLKTQQRVLQIASQNPGFWVTTATGGFFFDKVILATGYSPPGWQMAKSLGHTILEPVPSLFPFKISAPVLQGLPGISVSNAQGKLKTGASEKPVTAQGDLLITHTGLSGPVIYRLSAKAARNLAEAGYQGRLTLDLIPDFQEESLRELLKTRLQSDWGKKKMANTQFEHGIAHRFWLSLLTHSAVPLDVRGNDLPQAALNRIIESLKRLELPVQGKSPSKEEFVSCGGVALHEVDFRTLESKRCPGLYLAGEILDIDGLTGGFNFQACWSEAWVISESLRDI